MNMRTLFTTSLPIILLIIFFFFNDTATTEIYTLSLHDALPISWFALAGQAALLARLGRAHPRRAGEHALSIAPASRPAAAPGPAVAPCPGTRRRTEPIQTCGLYHQGKPHLRPGARRYEGGQWRPFALRLRPID